MKATTKIIIILTYALYVSIFVFFIFMCITYGNRKQSKIQTPETFYYVKPVTITDSNRIDYDWVNDNELHVNKRSVYDYMINCH